MEEAPRCTSLAPLASSCFALCLIGVETEGLLDYQGRTGIMSIVWWNLCPVIFGVDKTSFPEGEVPWGLLLPKRDFSLNDRVNVIPLPHGTLRHNAITDFLSENSALLKIINVWCLLMEPFNEINLGVLGTSW